MTKSRVRVAAVLCAVVWGAAAVCARPDGDAGAKEINDTEVVGILHVEVVGVSDTASGLLERSLEDGLGNAGYNVASREEMAGVLARTTYPDGCLFGPCMRTIYEQTGIRLVLVARITGYGRSYSYVITLIDTRTGVPTSQAVERCDVCTLDEAVASASMAVIGLVAGVGSATVVDPEAGPTGEEGVTDIKALRAEIDGLTARGVERKQRLRRHGLWMTGLALVSAGVGSYFVLSDDDEVGYPLAAAGAAFGIAGGTLLYISGTF